MPSIEIKIKNLSQIKSAFKSAPKLMTVELNKAIVKSVFKIQGSQEVKYRSLGINVITGGLINSIRRGRFFSNLRGEVGPNVTGSPGVPYAVFVHSGTRYMKSRPFLLEAIESDQRSIDSYFTKAVDNVLSAIGKAT